MIKLKKKYRLLWNDKKVIVSDHTREYEKSSATSINDKANYFESDSIEEVEIKIISEELTPKVIY